MRKAALALLLGVVCSPGAWAAGAEVPGPAGSPVETEEEDQEEDVDEDEEEDLRERLTEREDKRRPERSWSIPLADRPLTISGEVELEPRFVRRRVLDPERPDPTDPEFERDRLLTETGIEVEAFYTFGPVLSLFAQVRLTSERDLIDGVEDEVSDLYLEPGEIWLFSEDIAGTGLNFDAGRLDFEDERRWWWDDELDAARLAYEADALEISLAAVRPLLPDRTDQSYVEPERDRVFRLIGQASWDFRPNHGFELFAVHHDDRSSTERIGAVVKDELEDESDARLRWLGARAMGVFDLRPRGTLGYWLDLAWLRGKERFIEYDDDPALPRRSDAVEVIRRHVHGSAYDAGVSYAFTSVAGEPRLFGRHARGSRDFRQTDLEANEAGFGGVERFPHYGALLDPELSNLSVLTLGAGLSLLHSSSLDLVYHRYRVRDLDRPVTRNELEAMDFDAVGSDLGQEIDLILALEEWERFEFELGLAAFRAGHAFRPSADGETTLGAFFAVRYAF